MLPVLFWSRQDKTRQDRTGGHFLNCKDQDNTTYVWFRRSGNFRKNVGKIWDRTRPLSTIQENNWIVVALITPHLPPRPPHYSYLPTPIQPLPLNPTFYSQIVCFWYFLFFPITSGQKQVLFLVVSNGNEWEWPRFFLFNQEMRTDKSGFHYLWNKAFVKFSVFTCGTQVL